MCTMFLINSASYKCACQPFENVTRQTPFFGVKINFFEINLGNKEFIARVTRNLQLLHLDWLDIYVCAHHTYMVVTVC